MTTVRVPGSVANLGPGFDVLAMAVDLWLEVEAEPSDSPAWTFEGEAAEHLARHPNPLSRLPMRGRVRNGIPMGVGLGSSAAARVAAHALLGATEPWKAAGRDEGHLDNAAAAGLGGVRLVVAGVAHALPAPEAEVALLVASEPASTEAARRALPGLVPMADAVFNLGRVGLLVRLLSTGDLLAHPEALDDRLHQDHRRPLYPWTGDAIAAARALGFGAAISGAGPTVFALAAPGRGFEVAAAMAAAAPGRGRPLVTRVAASGMTIR